MFRAAPTSPRRAGRGGAGGLAPGASQGNIPMNSASYVFVLGCGVLALVYGWLTSRQVLTADAGNARMQEISE